MGPARRERSRSGLEHGELGREMGHGEGKDRTSQGDSAENVFLNFEYLFEF